MSNKLPGNADAACLGTLVLMAARAASEIYLVDTFTSWHFLAPFPQAPAIGSFTHFQAGFTL